MKPRVYELEITLKEGTFFASRELGDHYFTEPLLGNYALAYALGLIVSPYNRYHVGYAEDIPALNERGIYVTPAWPVDRPAFKIERFNCQSESYTAGMTNNAVVEAAGRQYLIPTKGGRYADAATGKTIISATNRPQTGVIKLLRPDNRFRCHLVSAHEIAIPRYIRLGKFMSKAKVESRTLYLEEQRRQTSVYALVNPIDLDEQSKIRFGDTIHIHPTPLIRNAEIETVWWRDRNGTPVVPAEMTFKGFRPVEKRKKRK